VTSPPRLAFALALLLVAGVAAELTARIDDYLRFGVPLLAAPSREALIFRDSLTVRGTPEGRFEHFALDSFGFLGPEIPFSPTAGCPRVMAIGASETFGFTEPDGKNYVSQLRDSLSTHGCFEVINAGIRGITGPNLITFWKRWGARFRPAFVVIYPTPNFYLDNEPPQPLRPVPPQTAGAAPLLHSRFVDHVHSLVNLPTGLQTWRVRRAIRRATAGRPPDWFFQTAPPERLALFRQDLDSLVTEVTAAGATPVLAVVATRYGRELSPEDRNILTQWRYIMPRATEPAILAFERSSADVTRRIARSRQALMVDADSVMTGHRDEFADSQHFTARGAGVLAGLVAHTILRAAGR
jgi:hypothetical protein